MLQFVKKIIFFCLMLSILSFGLEYLITETLKKSSAEPFLQWNTVFNKKINADIVINGSSKAWTQFSPLILQDSLNSSVYNLGVDGYPFLMQEAKYNLYKRNNISPKIVIQVASTNTLGKREGLYRGYQFSPYLSDSIINKVTSQYIGLSNIEKKMPLLKYSGEYNNILKGLINSFSNGKLYKSNLVRGYYGRPWDWDDSFNKFKKVNSNGITNIISEQSKSKFEKYLADCLRDEVILILVCPPSYFEAQKLINNYDEIMKIYTNYSKIDGVYFLDYSSSYLSTNKLYFYNSQHLNKKGSELFSQLLAEDIKNKILKVNDIENK